MDAHARAPEAAGQPDPGSAKSRRGLGAAPAVVRRAVVRTMVSSRKFDLVLTNVLVEVEKGYLFYARLVYDKCEAQRDSSSLGFALIVD